MKLLKKLATVMAATAIMSSSAFAQDDGDGYYESYGTTQLAPSIALGVTAAVAVVAVIVNNNSKGSLHTHHHCQ